ncbi:MAG: prepilin-type N-terminal cleavage/methylation domain-containing protein [Myxococcota bacterium]
MTRARRNARGLTLLEVLAATMIFALVMTVLVGTSTTAVHRSGVAARRLEANLLADAIVADLEIDMRKQIAPVLERTEWTTEDENYVVRVQNRSIQEALAAPAETVADEVAEANGAPSPGPSGAGATQIGGGAGIGTLLAGELPEVAKHLRQYDIEVVWIGPDGPESLTRTTFAFDWQAAKIEYAALFEGAGGTGDADAASDADEDADGRAPVVPEIPDLPQGGP